MVYLIVIIIKCNFVIFIKILEIGRRVSHPQLVSPLLRGLVRVLLLDLVHRGVLVEALDVPSQGVDHPHGVEVGEGPLPPAQPTCEQLDNSLQERENNIKSLPGRISIPTLISVASPNLTTLKPPLGR